MDYVYQPCVANNGAMLTAAYSPSGGTSPYFTAGNPAELGPVLQGLLTGVLSCTLDMNAIVTGNPALGTVTVSPAGGTPREVAINETGDGWRLEPNNYQVTLLGQACADYQTVPDTRVDISFPCAVAEPR